MATISMGYITDRIDLKTMTWVIDVKDEKNADSDVEMEMHRVASERMIKRCEALARLGLAGAAPAVPAIPVVLESPLVREAVCEYVEGKLKIGKWSERTKIDYQRFFEAFLDLVGRGVEVSKLTRQGMRELNKQIHNIPERMRVSPKFKGRSTIDCVNMDHGVPRNSETINKHLVCLKAFLKWCRAQDYTEVDFSDVLDLLVKGERGRVVLPFNDQQIKAIFDPSTYPRKKEGWKFWVPLIGLYMGLRLNEICQLYASDVREVDGVLCICVRGDREDQRLKTKKSNRDIPVHPALVSLGFREFVEGRESKRLWHGLKYHQNRGYQVDASKWFSRNFFVKAGVKGEGHSFQSFRHTFSTFVSNLVDIQRADDLCGRQAAAATSGGKAYDHGLPVALRLPIIERVEFPVPLERL